MMNRLFFSLIFLSSLLMSCKRESIYLTDPNATPEERKKTEERNRLISEITISFAKKMEQRFGLKMSGTGGGGDGKQINLIAVAFNSHNEMILSQARQLIMECTQDFIKEINDYEQLKNYTALWPFNFTNVKLDILFIIDRPERGLIPAPYTAAVIYDKGRLTYMEEIKGELEVVQTETYEEALAILNQNP
jgi:hypothetical protein